MGDQVSLSNILALLQGAHSVGLMWWMLVREVLCMHGAISREHPWEVMPDLYFYRDPEEVSFLHKGLWSLKQRRHLGLCFWELKFAGPSKLLFLS